MPRFAAYVLNSRYSLYQLTGQEKNPAAVELAKLRAKRLRPQRRTEIATNAGKARGYSLENRPFGKSRPGDLAGGKA
jgi:hypothetical protein